MKKIILTLLVLAFASTGFKCGKNDAPGGTEAGVFRGKLYDDHTFTTEAGATIAAKDSINPAFGPLVDGGVADLNRIASAPPNNYDVSDLPAARYRIWLFPRSSLCENAAFLVDASGSVYEGSEWDKDPRPNVCWICAAGMTIMQGFPVVTGPGMLITDDVGVMRTIVRYEGEHSVLFFKDPERYNATQYHTNGQGHPILGDGPPVEGSKFIVPGFESYAVSITLPADIAAGDRVVGGKGSKACVVLTK